MERDGGALKSPAPKRPRTNTNVTFHVPSDKPLRHPQFTIDPQVVLSATLQFASLAASSHPRCGSLCTLRRGAAVASGAMVGPDCCRDHHHTNGSSGGICGGGSSDDAVDSEVALIVRLVWDWCVGSRDAPLTFLALFPQLLYSGVVRFFVSPLLCSVVGKVECFIYDDQQVTPVNATPCGMVLERHSRIFPPLEWSEWVRNPCISSGPGVCLWSVDDNFDSVSNCKWWVSFTWGPVLVVRSLVPNQDTKVAVEVPEPVWFPSVDFFFSHTDPDCGLLVYYDQEQFSVDIMVVNIAHVVATDRISPVSLIHYVVGRSVFRPDPVLILKNHSGSRVFIFSCIPQKVEAFTQYVAAIEETSGTVSKIMSGGYYHLSGLSSSLFWVLKYGNPQFEIWDCNTLKPIRAIDSAHIATWIEGGFLIQWQGGTAKVIEASSGCLVLTLVTAAEMREDSTKRTNPSEIGPKVSHEDSTAMMQLLTAISNILLKSKKFSSKIIVFWSSTFA
ncbi:hypothetical protein Pelo_3035 [Pelomyxa schiedti]|nr:hypothetical protein Pelo_3035 [Pelomyxa schiedti]